MGVLKSRRLAACLIFYLFILIILSAFIPQKTLPPVLYENLKKVFPSFLVGLIEKSYLNRIHTSFWLWLPAVLLLLNLLFCTLSRISIHFKTNRRLNISFWGSILFHMSFFIIVIGLIFNQFSYLKGAVVLTEGETFTEDFNSYQWVEKGTFFSEHKGFSVRLESFDSEYKKGASTTSASDLVVLEDEMEILRKKVFVNNPLSYEGFVFYQTRDWGYSPRLIVRDAGGHIFLDAFISLANKEVDGKVIHEDTLSFMGAPFSFKFRFYPGKEPRLKVVVVQGDEEPFSSTLSEGEEVCWEGFSFSFDGFRYWTKFDVNKKPGLSLVFGGFCLGIVGLILSYGARGLKWGGSD